jgi:hypothetical protein
VFLPRSLSNQFPPKTQRNLKKNKDSTPAVTTNEAPNVKRPTGFWSKGGRWGAEGGDKVGLGLHEGIR